MKIALTATPALQTTEIFGQPVYKYTYREAVIEGYLVDHDAPHELKTKLSQDGIIPDQILNNRQYARFPVAPIYSRVQRIDR